MDDFHSVSEDSGVGDFSNHTTSETPGLANGDEVKNQLAESETKAVNLSKMLVISVLALAAGACGAATYFYTTSEEDADFRTQYDSFSLEVVDEYFHTSRGLYGTVHTMSTSIQSFASYDNADFPYVTLPDFAIRGGETNQLTHTESLVYAPLVTSSERATWENFTATHKEWGEEEIADTIYKLDENGDDLPEDSIDDPNYLPVWQTAPLLPYLVNYNLLSDPTCARIFKLVVEQRQSIHSEVTDVSHFLNGDQTKIPHSYLMQPVFKDFEEDAPIVGVIVTVVSWSNYFDDILTEDTNGIQVVIQDLIGAEWTFEVVGDEPSIFLGSGDLHEQGYEDMEFDHRLATADNLEMSDDDSDDEGEDEKDGSEDNSEDHEHDEEFHRRTDEADEDNGDDETVDPCDEGCLRVYPTTRLNNVYITGRPGLYTSVVVMIFVFTSIVFVLYDCLVQRRQDYVMATAQRTNKIVSSLFPSNVRDRLLEEAEARGEAEEKGKRSAFGLAPKNKLRDFLDGEETAGVDAGNVIKTKPIADLFPSTTILFADIVGFTAWSSMREPSQVFQLLEACYHCFDTIAKQRRVFKVETIGDCYVAVTGLPEPRKDHGPTMARFAADCMAGMGATTKALESSLGPDTGDLTLRIGLHSGPVTAGVLRGEKSRFQLFGDSVNTAARMESNGEPGRIHMSAETAELLVQAGKSHWIQPREGKVSVKGKGDMQTFWLKMTSATTGSKSSGGSSCNGYEEADFSMLASVENDLPTLEMSEEKLQRLVKWNVDAMLKFLQKQVARHSTYPGSSFDSNVAHFGVPLDPDHNVINEVKEIVPSEKFDAKALKRQEEASDQTEISTVVIEQLYTFVSEIARSYENNAFHNFEHASHVAMSVVKLMSRIVAPADISVDKKNRNKNLHDHTYGITSSPLMQFAVFFSALIHDVGHPGVPNLQLVKEKTSMAVKYHSKSVAEQNSVDVAWSIFMEDRFLELRETICKTPDEKARFRQLVVNCVMATDIVDRDLKNLRNARWDNAFHTEKSDRSSLEDISRKATVVIEHLIQASDVCHTMQHWHVYRKWNERFFKECYAAYKDGRAEQDPSVNWYEGELGFFDFYIIPLTKKLKECGVFGVSSDEYLTYAQSNRREWAERGREVVAEMVAAVHKEKDCGSTEMRRVSL